jgi:hypothetical protein
MGRFAEPVVNAMKTGEPKEHALAAVLTMKRRIGPPLLSVVVIDADVVGQGVAHLLVVNSKNLPAKTVPEFIDAEDSGLREFCLSEACLGRSDQRRALLSLNVSSQWAL